MTAVALTPEYVEKPWGRRDLAPLFGQIGADRPPVGEIWFGGPGGADRPLLVKYLFTSEKLSIQVHPDDEQARAAGYRSGKDEAWVVLAADPDAVIGIGLRAPVSREALRAAALDGSIEELVDWRPAAAGDVYYSPAGTVHALGPGLALIEVQQNVDLTYRLYDYGRPRELHLEAGIAVAKPAPYEPPFEPREQRPGRLILAEGAFVLERWSGAAAGRLQAGEALPVWLIPVAGEAKIDGADLKPGTAWVVEGPAELSIAERSDLLIAYPRAKAKADLLV
ncbi:MAG TPA: class I mannose-6-phosphate isomerase [Allosphingosinicella sp.]|nr:class I mannose-6-phosphate isomerase [Allosphingosinicella sp.]